VRSDPCHGFSELSPLLTTHGHGALQLGGDAEVADLDLALAAMGRIGTLGADDADPDHLVLYTGAVHGLTLTWPLLPWANRNVRR
jgi:hypothetical protein